MALPTTPEARALMWQKMRDWLDRGDAERERADREFMDMIGGNSFARQYLQGEFPEPKPGDPSIWHSFHHDPSLPADRAELRDPVTGKVLSVIIGVDLAADPGITKGSQDPEDPSNA